MKRIKEIELTDIINELPEIIPLDCKKEFSDDEYDIFFCALGFEDRCLTIPEQLTEIKGFKCKEAYYFEYSTNIEDNAVNRPRLINAFKKFAISWDSIQCDVEDFTKRLRELLSRAVKAKQKPKVIFDISVCSSKLLLLAMKILLEFDVYLRIVYSEAAIYHPTLEEYEKEPEKWTTEKGFGIARGVGQVIPSPEHPGSRRENPDLIIAFLTFKPERTEAIIADIDETLLRRPSKRVICIIGDPHIDEITKVKRKEMMRKINEKILEDAISYEVCTLNYKETLKILDQIYKSKNLDFHINISALGSKMQSLGISLFWYIRPDVSIYLAIPKEYNPKQYSEGCKATWQVDFGNLGNIRGILDKVGQLEINNR
jgi:hypothetical protein